MTKFKIEVNQPIRPAANRARCMAFLYPLGGGTMNKLFEKLKESGLTVHIDHLRRVKNSNSYVSVYVLRNDMKAGLNPRSIMAKGGKTVAKILIGDKLVGSGETVCHPEWSYVRKRGAERALARAYRNAVNSGKLLPLLPHSHYIETLNAIRQDTSPALA